MLVAAACVCWTACTVVFDSPVEVEAMQVVGVAAVGWDTGMVETGMLNATVMSGLCCTGEVAVWAWFCFSLFRHLALRFWNQTYMDRIYRWRHHIGRVAGTKVSLWS